MQAFGKYFSKAFILNGFGLFGSTNLASVENLAVVELHHFAYLSRVCEVFEFIRFLNGGVVGTSSQRSRSISLSTVTQFTMAALVLECLSLHTRAIIVQPKLYSSAQGSSLFPELTLIGWKAAGSFRSISRPISTSRRCCISAAM